jgi:hypothetical protein
LDTIGKGILSADGRDLERYRKSFVIARLAKQAELSG